MSIPENQLETWARPGAVTTAKATHESIRCALSHQNSPIKQKVESGDVEVYLQGSYKNDTNVRGDSDVDVVVQLNATFQYATAHLPTIQQEMFEAAYPGSATYGWSGFRTDVVAALQSYYGATTVNATKKKAIAIKGGNGRLPADVLVCLKYNHYQYFYRPDTESHIEGVVFYTNDAASRKVINFPKPHYENGVAKNNESNTNGWFKPTVRMFKNARGAAIDRGLLRPEAAPSYFLQGLIYNVPAACFGTSYQHTFRAIVEWLRETTLDSFVCQNGQLPLFGPSPEQWSEADAQTTVAAYIDLWNTF